MASPNKAILHTLCEITRNLIRFYMNGGSKGIFEEAKVAFIKARSPNLKGRTEGKSGNELSQSRFEMGSFLQCKQVAGRSHATHELVHRRLPSAAARVLSHVRWVGFVVDKMAPGPVISEYFCIPRQFSFHKLLRNHHLYHPKLVQ
jgi:hypothetical protein